MGLEELFVCPRALKRHREKPLGNIIDGFHDWLKFQRYARTSIITHIECITRFSKYLQTRDINHHQELTRQHCETYLRECSLKRKKKTLKDRVNQSELYAINRFLEYLRAAQNKSISLKPILPHQELIDQYTDWLSIYHHCSLKTVNLRKRYLRQFLELLGTEPILERLSTLSFSEVEELFLAYSTNRGHAARRSMQATLRTFFKFSLDHKIISQDLSKSIPTIRTYKLSSVPRGISEENAQKVLSIIDRNTQVGKRDYAILQLLYHYGIRAGQVRALSLEDIDWRKNIISFQALKHGKAIVFPLLNEVGKAILDYLQHVRPQSEYSEVFLRTRVPYQPLGSHSSISEIIARLIKKANIELSSCGAHAFRHGFAQRMLRQGNSLKPIADCLGHCSIQTTSIYAKVDFVALANVPLELPTKEAL